MIKLSRRHRRVLFRSDWDIEASFAVCESCDIVSYINRDIFHYFLLDQKSFLLIDCIITLLLFLSTLEWVVINTNQFFQHLARFFCVTTTVMSIVTADIHQGLQNSPCLSCEKQNGLVWPSGIGQVSPPIHPLASSQGAVFLVNSCQRYFRCAQHIILASLPCVRKLIARY